MQLETLGTPMNTSAPEPEFSAFLHLPIRIAVVDDSRDFLEVLCDLLRMFPSVEIIATGSDGLEALGLVRTLQPDLLIMDVNMPVLDGIGTATMISNSGSSTKVLLMSADGGTNMRERCRRSPAHGFISKHDLASRLRNILP
jgi:two-component system, NarL family, nitrate/nitrite response regulator NarL